MPKNNTKTSNKSSSLKRRFDITNKKVQFFVVIGIVAILGGGYFTLRSFAATVSIASPLNNSTVMGSVTFSANTSATNVTKVDFVVNGKMIATDQKPPYSVILNTTNYPDGSHKLSVRAYDAQGNYSQANSTINIRNNSSSPAPTDSKSPAPTTTSPNK